MNAYSKIYLEDAMNVIGVMMDYGTLADGDSQRFFDRFVVSGVSRQIERGNPKYIAGHSGVELAEQVLKETGSSEKRPPYRSFGRSPEYWSGWVLAYIQWHTGKSFGYLAGCGINLNLLLRLYPTLHEADISKVVSVIQKIHDDRNDGTAALKRQRTLAGFTQRTLAEAAGVKVRMIQAYEQNRQDITKAEFATVLRLSRCLGCSPEDLVDTF